MKNKIVPLLIEFKNSTKMKIKTGLLSLVTINIPN